MAINSKKKRDARKKAGLKPKAKVAGLGRRRNSTYSASWNSMETLAASMVAALNITGGRRK